MLTFVTFIAVISLLILVHEAGHLIAAKLTGMKVDEFALGMGPKLFTVYFDGETTYSINLLPVGGYVKIHGEDGSPDEDTDHAFVEKPILSRAFVLVAGVCMNYVLALILIAGLLIFAGEPVVHVTLPILSLSETSPLLPHATNNTVITGYLDEQNNTQPITSSSEFIDYIKAHAGANVTLLILQGDDTVNSAETPVTLIPRQNPPEGEGALGVSIAEDYQVTYEKVPLFSVIPQTFKVTHSLLGAILAGLFDMFAKLFTEGTVPSDIAGPVGIAKLTGEAAKQGLASLTQFTALISLNLALLNLMPFPALDGGRLFFLLIECMTQRKVPAKIEGWIHVAGLLILLCLIAVVTFFDIQRFF